MELVCASSFLYWRASFDSSTLNLLSSPSCSLPQEADLYVLLNRRLCPLTSNWVQWMTLPSRFQLGSMNGAEERDQRKRGEWGLDIYFHWVFSYWVFLGWLCPTIYQTFLSIQLSRALCLSPCLSLSLGSCNHFLLLPYRLRGLTASCCY